MIELSSTPKCRAFRPSAGIPTVGASTQLLLDVRRIRRSRLSIDRGAPEAVRGTAAMRRILAKKNVHGLAADRLIEWTLLQAHDCYLERARRDANRADRQGAAKQLCRLIIRLEQLVRAIAALPKGEIGKLNKALSPLLAGPFDTEVFEGVIAAIARESEQLAPEVKARRIRDAIYEPVSETCNELRRGAESELIDGWSLIPASTRISAETTLRIASPERSITRWLRRLIAELDRHPDRCRRGADPALAERFVRRVALDWFTRGYKVGCAKLTDCRAGRGVFEQFCAGALVAVGRPTTLSEYQIKKFKARLARNANARL